MKNKLYFGYVWGDFSTKITLDFIGGIAFLAHRMISIQIDCHQKHHKSESLSIPPIDISAISHQL